MESRPLAITNGDLQYAYAKYDIAEISSGKYDLVIPLNFADLERGFSSNSFSLATIA